MTWTQAITKEGSSKKWHSRRQKSVQISLFQTKKRKERMGEGKGNKRQARQKGRPVGNLLR